MNTYDPESVSPPGETLKELLEEKMISLPVFAFKTVIPLMVLESIIKGKRRISTAIAHQLAHVLDVPVEFWEARQQKYDDYLERRSKNG